MISLRLALATLLLSLSVASATAHHAAVACGSGKTCERTGDKDSGH